MRVYRCITDACPHDEIVRESDVEHVVYQDTGSALRGKRLAVLVPRVLCPICRMEMCHEDVAA